MCASWSSRIKSLARCFNSKLSEVNDGLAGLLNHQKIKMWCHMDFHTDVTEVR